MLKVGSDFSGVGAFDQALKRLKIDYKTIFACDWDKYARQTYIENYGEPKYFPKDVYERKIPNESLDIYMTSPPCQAFSLAGKRKGEDDKRGVLFYNSHQFIENNKPRYFIFENVRGLLSDSNGRTFQIWCDMLGGKSVNGNSVLFPRQDATPYHIYHKVLNAKHYGVPQNRERVFIIGIRDDADNTFRFPKKQHLTKRLKDVLEADVNEKYFLSEQALKSIIYNDSISLSQPKSKTRRGRVGKEVAQTLDTGCTQGVWIADYRADEGLRIRKDNISPCMTSSMQGGEWKANRGTRNPPLVYNNKRLNKTLELNKNKLKDGCFVDSYNKKLYEEITPTITTTVNASSNSHIYKNTRIRRLTPRECFRLMDFPEDFKWTVSDTQAYKQAGNSIVVNVLYELLKKLL